MDQGPEASARPVVVVDHREHVGFESWLERDHVMLMDFDPGITGIASQPFWLHWQDGDGRAARMSGFLRAAG